MPVSANELTSVPRAGERLRDPIFKSLANKRITRSHRLSFVLAIYRKGSLPRSKITTQHAFRSGQRSPKRAHVSW